MVQQQASASKNMGRDFYPIQHYVLRLRNRLSSDFDFLVNERMVSSSCLALWQAPRTIECYEDVLFRIVESFKILNADTDTAISNFITIQQTICNVNSLSVQVFLHPCVNAVNITMYSTGTDYYTTVVRDATGRGPYTLFGMVGAKNYDGQHIPVGKYMLGNNSSWFRQQDPSTHYCCEGMLHKNWNVDS